MLFVYWLMFVVVFVVVAKCCLFVQVFCGSWYKCCLLCVRSFALLVVACCLPVLVDCCLWFVVC